MRGILLPALLLLWVGCHKHPVVTSGGIEVYERFWQEARDQVAARARIELGCGHVTPVLVAKQGRYPTEVSVDGCGRSALYQRVLRRHHGKYTTKNTVWQAVAVSPASRPAPLAPAFHMDDEMPPPAE